MADNSERISPQDVEFDEAGRAIIKNPETVARLRGIGVSEAAKHMIKNIGCCSVAAEREATGFPESAEGAARRLEKEMIKNIGCCSVV